MERICGKYCVTLSDGLNAGEGLTFPHNGPFVINPEAVIGKYCTIQAVLFCNNAHTAYFLFILKPVKKALFYDFFNFVYFTCPTAFFAYSSRYALS